MSGWLYLAWVLASLALLHVMSCQWVFASQGQQHIQMMISKTIITCSGFENQPSKQWQMRAHHFSWLKCLLTDLILHFVVKAHFHLCGTICCWNQCNQLPNELCEKNKFISSQLRHKIEICLDSVILSNKHNEYSHSVTLCPWSRLRYYTINIVQKLKDFSPSDMVDIDEGHSGGNVWIWQVIPRKTFFYWLYRV